MGSLSWRFFLSFLNSGELPAFQRCVKHAKIFRGSVLTQVELLLKSDFPDFDIKVCYKVWADFKGAKLQDPLQMSVTLLLKKCRNYLLLLQ